MNNKSWRESNKQFLDEQIKGDGWMVMALIAVAVVALYGFGLLPTPSFFSWISRIG